MLKPVFLRQFKKEVEKIKRRGKNMEKFKDVARKLLNEDSLPLKNRNHKLRGDFKNYWECHIEPDWLLIYKKTAAEIIFVRMGTHADLF